MKYEIPEARKKLLEALTIVSEMYGDINLLRFLTMLISSMDWRYVSDEELLSIIEENYEYTEYVEDSSTFDRKESIMHSVALTQQDLDTWNNRNTMALLSGDHEKRTVLNKENEALAYYRFSTAIKYMTFVSTYSECTLTEFMYRYACDAEQEIKYFEGWSCHYNLSYIHDCGWVRWPEMWTICMNEDGEWNTITGTYCKIPYFTETLGACIERGKPVSFSLVFDYESPICADNYCNLVNFGVFVDARIKRVTFVNKYKAVMMFHTLYEKHIKSKEVSDVTSV